MNKIVGAGFLVAGALGGYYAYTQSSNLSPDYQRSEIYAQCDRDYLQSAPYLGFRASQGECECFDDKLQQISPSQRSAAYKSLEDRLTLAFMGKAGANVEGTNVQYTDAALGEVNASVKIETSGHAIMEQCSMF